MTDTIQLQTTNPNPMELAHTRAQLLVTKIDHGLVLVLGDRAKQWLTRYSCRLLAKERKKKKTSL